MTAPDVPVDEQPVEPGPRPQPADPEPPFPPLPPRPWEDQ